MMPEPMPELPYIDVHRARVAASPRATWDALEVFAHRRLRRGFSVVHARPPSRLVLRGSHPFARYELAFDIEQVDNACALVATTYAVFPHIHGEIYRTLVIRSRLHKVVVRRMLRDIKRSAETRH